MLAICKVLRHPTTGPAPLYPFNLASESGPGDESQAPAHSGRTTPRREDLPYKVELWDEDKTSVEQVLAVTANGTIGYAAYYAATREYPSRYITLRQENRIISRWNGPGH
jgi:hypothetical protein